MGRNKPLRRKRLFVLELSVLALIGGRLSLQAGEVLGIGLNGGVPRVVEDVSGANYSFCIGGVYFYKPIEWISVGARISYNRWLPPEGAPVMPDSATAASVTRNASITEIGPFLRLSTSFYHSPINIFAHLGGGAAMVRQSKTEYTATANGGVSECSSDSLYRRVGISGGAGVTIGKSSRISVELFPLYHVVFLKKGPCQFVSTSLMFVFDLID